MIEDGVVRKRSRHEFSIRWRRGILSESPVPATRNATITTGSFTEHGMRFLRWKTICAAAMCVPLFAAAQQQPSDYAREKRWADEIVPQLVSGEPVWLEAPRSEKVVLLSHSMGSRMANHYVGAHPLVPLAGWISLSISSGEFAPIKRVKFPIFDVYAENDFDAVLRGSPKRAAVLKRMRGSSQAMVFATDHFFAKKEKELVSLIGLLLEGEKK